MELKNIICHEPIQLFSIFEAWVYLMSVFIFLPIIIKEWPESKQIKIINYQIHKKKLKEARNERELEDNFI
jgi:hypothetical protein